MGPARIVLAGLAAALSLVGGARADAVSERPDSVSITAYRDPVPRYADPEYWRDYWTDWSATLDLEDGLVLVSEVRTVDVPAGPGRVSFRGVAEGIVPQTAAIEGLPGPVLERNQDYDLLTPASLIDRSVGKTVRITHINPASGRAVEETATVRTGPRGTVLDYGDGRVEAVGCGGWPERIAFEAPPDGLVDKPVLSVRVDAPRAGRYRVKLTYLALGVKWGADYVASVHPDGRTLDLLAWITLTNRTNSSFVEAQAQVLAGEVARDDDTAPPQVTLPVRSPQCWGMDTTTHGKLMRERAMAPAPPEAWAGGDVEALIVTAQKREENIQDVPIALSARESDLADYKLYTLPAPTTVAAHQSKQVMMFSQTDVPFQRLYVARLDRWEEPEARAVLRLDNKRGARLGRALPAGMVRVTQPYGGGMLLTGQDSIDDSPVGLPVDIELGGTFGVSVTAVESDQTAASRREQGDRYKAEVAMVNDRSEPVVIELRMREGRYTKLVSASRRHGRRYSDLVWTIKLRPGERKTMRYAIDEID